ncbi:uncharacterized protein LOC141613411 [Silene latifolia]|uniref:uncharacterized protein LOC141613411 n=1 Tax=Silene latifolia TaxID=37657 RepID=UPI003D76A9A5
MSAPEADQAQALLIPHQDDVDCRNEMQEAQGDTRLIGICEAICNFKHLKCFHIMKSALTIIITTSTKLMSLMIFSIIPLYVFMVFYEIQLLKAIVAAPNALKDHHNIITMYYSSNGSRSHSRISRIHEYDDKVGFLTHVLLLCLLYFVIYPLLEILSMTITIQIAAKVYANEKPAATLKDVFYRRNNLKGVLITCGYVHLVSCLTLLGLIWVVMNSLLFSGTGTSVYWVLDDPGSYWHILSVGIHTIIFVALLYKYSEWSAFWSLSMVISVLEEESGLDAFGMANYYGKQFKPTRVQLMAASVGFGILLRLPYLFGGSSNWIVPGVVIGLVCLGYLIKWVAFVLYYFDCKHQTMEKKNDEEIGKPVNIG